MPVMLQDIELPGLAASARRFSQRKQRITEVIDCLRKNDVSNMDTRSREALYLEREKHFAEDEGIAVTAESVSRLGLEAIINNNDILPIAFLERGRLAANAVAHITIGNTTGSGVLISPDLLLTNWHVLSSSANAQYAEVEMFFERSLPDGYTQTTLYLDPERFFHANKTLDYSMIALERGQDTQLCGWLPLLKEQGKVLVGHPVSIIHHPGGGGKKITLHGSYLVDLTNHGTTQDFCWYSGDTQTGSSGSPVFNTRWEIVALHHRAVPHTDKNNVLLDKNGKSFSEQRLNENPDALHWIANEGTRASRIVQDLEQAPLAVHEVELRDEAMALWAKRGWRKQ